MLRDIKILYADSDPIELESLAIMVQQYGWEGDQAMSASEIVNKVNLNCSSGGKCYDAIITALNFFDEGSDPYLTGVTAAKMIRKVRTDVPIVFISDHNNSLIREEVRRVSGELMTKPIDTYALFDRIEQLVIWYRQTQASRYDGDDRRIGSINRSGNFRRNTDMGHEITIPDRLVNLIEEVKEENNERRESESGPGPNYGRSD